MGLDLDYNPAVAPRLLEAMERWGRKVGASLHELELMGQCERTCRAFVRACERERHRRFLERLDTDRLERLLRARRTAHDASAFSATLDPPGIFPAA